MPTPIPTRSQSKAVRKLSHRQPLPRQWNARLRVFLDSAGRPVMRLGIYTAILALLGYFSYHVYASDRFKLETVRIAGTERVAAEQVRSLLVLQQGIEEGVSMFSISPRQVVGLVESLPAVRNAHVTRVWPRGLLIEVEERRTTGIFVSPNGSYAIDETGKLFAPASAEDLRDIGGPVWTGWQNLHPEKGSELPTEQFRSIVRGIETIRLANPELYSNLSEVRWDDEEGLTLVMADGGLILQGFLPMEKAGPIIESVFEEQTEGMALNYLRLTLEDSLAVAWRPAPVRDTLLLAAKEQ